MSQSKKRRYRNRKNVLLHKKIFLRLFPVVCIRKVVVSFLHQLLKDLTRCFPIIELKSGIRNASRVCHKAYGSSVK